MKPDDIDEILHSLKSDHLCDWGYVEGALPSSYSQYQAWVEKGHHTPLGYMADHRKELRENLKNYYSDFQSALVFLFSYAPEKKAQDQFYQKPESNGLKIASYALSFGAEDYHHVIQDELNQIGSQLKEKREGLEFKQALDIHPVLDRDLAFRAGLGWFGKNSMLISRKEGSFVMIGSILLNQKFELSVPEVETDHCGSCRACIDACPTLAIGEETRQIEASRCISTFTIETFKPARAIAGHVENGSGEIFGCDICQDVCPWNRRPLKVSRNVDWPSSSTANKISDLFLRPDPEKIVRALKNMSKREYKRTFKGTALERTGRDGLIKNIELFTKTP